MNTDNTNSQDSESADAFELVAHTMNEFREDMDDYNLVGTRIASRTRTIMLAFFGILAISSIYLVYMIFHMADNMTVMTSHLETMYDRFGSMSQDMREITSLVDSMENSVTGVPVIAESMIKMNGDVIAMNGSVYSINTLIDAIDIDMARINMNMQEMTASLYNINRTTNAMSYDMSEMTAPTRKGPMSWFWPR